MKPDFKKPIAKIISKTKLHKDIFAVPELVRLLRRNLEQDPAADPAWKEETILLFVQQVIDALESSPIYSDTLVRDLYQKVLDVADSMGLARESLLEDLLFQSIRRPKANAQTRQKKQKDARSRIIKSALDEFSEKGFHSTTIDSIAERAGIAKGTLYRYFKTKEALFNAMKEDTISEFVELSREKLRRETDVLKIIEGVIRIYLSFFETNSAFFKVIIQEQKDFGREFSEKFIKELLLATPDLKRRCWRASRVGHLKQMDYFTVFFGMVGFLNGVIQKWLHEGGVASLQDEIPTVKEVLFYGVVAGPEKREEDENRTSNTLRVIS